LLVLMQLLPISVMLSLLMMLRIPLRRPLHVTLPLLCCVLRILLWSPVALHVLRRISCHPIHIVFHSPGHSAWDAVTGSETFAVSVGTVGVVVGII